MQGAAKERGGSDLRIAHAGFIQFVAQLSSLLTGLLFVTLITRNLSVSEFGTWQLVGSASGLALFPTGVLLYWSIRGIARGEDIGKTSLVAWMISLPMSFIVFLIVSIGIGSRVDLILVAIVAGLVQLPPMTLFESVKGMVQGSRPVLLGYSTIPFELAKVGIAYYLVVIHKIGLQGAIFALAAAYAAQDILLVYGIRDKLGGRVDIRRIGKWVKAGWVPLLTSGVGRIWSFDAIIVALMIGSAEPVGLFQGARVFTAIILYSEIFLRVLYPKLIRDRSASDVGVAFRLQTLLGAPMVLGTLVLAEEMLSVLGPGYTSSSMILRLLSIVALIEGIEHLMHFVLYGAETSDSKPTGLSFANLRSSWLVKLPLLDLTKAVAYVVVLAGSLYFFAIPSSSQDVALVWAGAYTAIAIPYTFVKVFFARRLLPHSLPLKDVLTYLLASVGMALVLFWQKAALPVAGSGATETLIRLSTLVGLGAAVYFFSVYLLNPYFRGAVTDLVKSGKLRS